MTEAAIQISVVSMAGNVVCELEIPGQEFGLMTVGGLKHKVQDEVNYMMQSQDLFFGTQALPDSCFLSEAVTDGAAKLVVFLVRRRVQRIVSGHTDHILRLWDPKQSDQPIIEFRAHTDHVVSVVLKPSGDLLLSGSRSGTIILWDAIIGTPLHIITTCTSCVVCLEIDWKSMTILSGHSDGTVYVWHCKNEEFVPTIRYSHESLACVAVDWSSYRTVSGSWHGDLEMWDLTHGKCLQRVGNFRAVSCLAMNWATSCALSGGGDGSLQLTFFQDKRSYEMKGHNGRVCRLDANWSTKRAISVSWDGTLRLWDLETRQLLQSFGESVKRQMGHAGVPSCLAVDWIGEGVASGHRNGCLRQWDLSGCEPKGTKLAQITRVPILCLAACWDMQLEFESSCETTVAL